MFIACLACNEKMKMLSYRIYKVDSFESKIESIRE